MNILTEKLPSTVNIDGAEYAINSDFQTAITFEIMVEEFEGEDQTELVKKAVMLFFPTIPSDITEAVNKIIWFYSCGEDTKSGNKAQEGNGKRVYSFKHDSKYIYSAFYQQYGIDLQNSKLHWWKFRTLFNCLSDDCLISKIMGYRGVDVTSDMSKGEKERIRKLKQIYALPLKEADQNRLDDIEKALMGDGDLDGLL